MIEKLITRVKGMEDRLCRCQERKGKGKAVEVLSSPVLGSPLVLDRPLAGSDGSYHTPPVAPSPVIPSSSSGSDKENVVIESKLVEIKDEVTENTIPVAVPAPELDFQGIARLLTVCGQCAVWSKGSPKSTYHPYTCSLGTRASLPGRCIASTSQGNGQSTWDIPTWSIPSTFRIFPASVPAISLAWGTARTFTVSQVT